LVLDQLVYLRSVYKRKEGGWVGQKEGSVLGDATEEGRSQGDLGLGDEIE
jgi:hypothetical protein